VSADGVGFGVGGLGDVVDLWGGWGVGGWWVGGFGGPDELRVCIK